MAEGASAAREYAGAGSSGSSSGAHSRAEAEEVTVAPRLTIVRDDPPRTDPAGPGPQSCPLPPPPWPLVPSSGGGAPIGASGGSQRRQRRGNAEPPAWVRLPAVAAAAAAAVAVAAAAVAAAGAAVAATAGKGDGGGGQGDGDGDGGGGGGGQGDEGDDEQATGGPGGFLVNFGKAVRVLRDDLPQLLARPLQWHIYRSDVALVSPWLPPLRGLRRYRLLHRLIRAVARALYRTATIELLRMWTPPSPPSGGGSGGGGTSSGTGRGTRGTSTAGVSRGTSGIGGSCACGPADDLNNNASGAACGCCGGAWPHGVASCCWAPEARVLHPNNGADAAAGCEAHSILSAAVIINSSSSGSTAAVGGTAGSSSRSSSQQQSGDKGGGDGGGYPAGGQQLLRVRWRMVAQPWLPWSDEQRLEVIATYRFDQRGKVAVHELTSLVPPEPPLLLWPLLLVARMLGRVVEPDGVSEPQGGPRGRQPIPGAGLVRQAGETGGKG